MSKRQRLHRSCVIAVLAVGSEPVTAKLLSGSTSLVPGQAKVVAKFCFDYNPACKDHASCTEPPGLADFDVFGARDSGSSSASSSSGASFVGGKKVSQPDVSIALLDDEYFSYPEVSQVWGEANCSDVKKSAKKAYNLDWGQISSAKGMSLHTHIVEKVRPRWWYVALVSCSDHALEMEYRMHLENLLQGSNSQLSMDEIGAVSISLLLAILFVGLVAAHGHSFLKWGERRCGVPAGHSLLAASLVLGLLGELCWLAFFMHYKASGQSADSFAFFARAFVAASKTLLQILLMLLAHGDCVCKHGIIWARQREMIGGMILFGLLGFALEVWGDREASNTPVEYIYDTRPGVALVALEMMWFYAYASRCWQTFSAETRQRPRFFYKQYATVLSLWFVSLPLVAALASILAPWVRFRITFAVSGVAHALAAGVLVYLFQPKIAEHIFELKAKDREAVDDDAELDSFLASSQDDDDDGW